MRKILIAFIAAASIGAMSVATSSKAEAWWGWWGPGAVIGAFVGGAVVGSAIATRPYYPPPYYYGPYPYYGPRCRSVWNGYTWVPAC